MGKGYVIAAVGSGGKTTLLELIAREAKASGRKAVVMTTTHMRIPDQHSGVGRTPEEAMEQMIREGMVYYGICGEEEGKMEFPGWEAYEALCERADVILVEADGSRRLPMKVPDWSREPVLPENVDMILVVFGLSALGRPFKEVCHRWGLGLEWLSAEWMPGGQTNQFLRERFQETSQNLGERFQETDQSLEKWFQETDQNLGEQTQWLVTEKIAADVLEEGYLKPIRSRFPDVRLITLLNQADGRAAQESGERMRERLEKDGFEAQVVCLRPVTLSVIYLASGFGRRFGRNKLLEMLEGKRLFEYGLETILKLKEHLEKEMGIGTRVIVVSQYPEILDFGRERGLQTIENPFAAEGITASIRLGTQAAGEDDYYLYAVADQPWLRWETVAGLIEHFLPRSYSELASIGCLEHGGRRGNPGIFHKRYREELLALKGDKGGSQLMKRYPHEVMEYPAEARELEDMDQPV